MSAEIGALLRRYAEAYMAGDAHAVADMCEVPLLAVRGGEPIHPADRPAVVEHFAGLMAAYRKAGAAVADLAAIEILDQGDSAALATARWHVRSAAGVLIRDFRTTYQLLGPDPWRIVSYVNHDTVRPDRET